jgi:RNA polymerase sigma factor (sigma-70 family)
VWTRWKVEWEVTSALRRRDRRRFKKDLFDEFSFVRLDEDRTPAQRSQDALTLLLARGRRQEILSAMEGLDFRERQVLVEHFFRERRLAAIARDLGISHSRVSTRRNRGLKKRRLRLADLESD